MSTAVNISSSEMIGAKFVLLVCNGTPGRMGGTETCFYYVSVNFDRTYCFFWQKFCCWSSSVLRIENLIKSYHCPWKWLFQNEVRGRRWDKACFVCSAGKHQRLGRESDARTELLVWLPLQCKPFSASAQLVHISCDNTEPKDSNAG